MPDLQNLSLRQLKLRANVQPREQIDEQRAAAWAELLIEDPEYQFPPLDVFMNPRNQDILVADGFTRHRAYTIAERTLIPCNVFEGDEGDAGWHALSANSKHGNPLNHDEQRAVIEKALDHRNRGEMTIKQLARLLGVGERSISRVISEKRNTKAKAQAISRGEREAKDRFSPEAIEAIDKIGECNENAKLALLNGSIKKPEDELIAFAELDCPTQLSLAPYFFTSDLNLKSAINAIAKRPTSIDRPIQDFIHYTMMKGVGQTFYFADDTVQVDITLLLETPKEAIVKSKKSPIAVPEGLI